MLVVKLLGLAFLPIKFTHLQRRDEHIWNWNCPHPKNIYAVTFLRTHFSTSMRKICSCEDEMQHQSSRNLHKVTVVPWVGHSTANDLTSVQTAKAANGKILNTFKRCRSRPPDSPIYKPRAAVSSFSSSLKDFRCTHVGLPKHTKGFGCFLKVQISRQG